MTLANVASSPRDTVRPVSFIRTAYSGLSPRVLLALVGLDLLFTLSRTVNSVLVEIRDGEFLRWLGEAGGEFVAHGAMALVMVAILAPVVRLGPARGWQRGLALGAALLVAAPLCALMRMVYVQLAMDPSPWSLLFPRYLVRFSVRYGYMAALILIVVEFYRHEVTNIAAMHEAEVDRLALGREMEAARLQVLQAQIEPHFLFNTLANVRRLYQTDAVSGRQMLDNLMRYLEVALPRMRDDTSTLDREALLIEAFLNVQKIRMGRRLSFVIDIPAELRPLSLPPMMLLTLVENALKHGLNPLPEGGMVRISARRDGDRLVVAVADSGRGFGEGTSGGGTGLANIRARLAAVFGGHAALELSANLPRGVTATLALPAASNTAVAT